MDDELETWLAELASDVLPAPKERGVAKRAHKELRVLLNNGEMQRRIVRSYLSGSYRRHTATTPLNDVDIVFEIIPERWKVGLWEELPSPQGVVTTFARALRDRLKPVREDTRVSEQRRSVGVDFAGVHVDVVPAVPLFDRDDDDDGDDDDKETEDEDLVQWEDENSSDRVMVPDRRKNEWIVSNPRAHVRAASRLNASRGLFKPCVRLLKTWNDHHGGLVSSFTVETIAAHVFARADIETFTDGVSAVWEFIATRAGLTEDSDEGDDGVLLHTRWHGFSTINVPDIAGTGGNVVAGVAEEDVARFAKKAHAAVSALASAARARSAHSVDERLCKLFGVES